MATTENQQKARKPRGESPEEAIERVAPTPGTFSLSLSGNGDAVAPGDLRDAYHAFVRAAREAGFTVNGSLQAHSPARRVDGELIPAEVVHDLAVDIDAEEPGED